MPRTKSIEKMTLISVHLPRSILYALDNISKESGVSRSELIRYAISHTYILNMNVLTKEHVQSNGFRVHGLKILLKCKNNHILAELNVVPGISIKERSELIGKLGLRCPICGSASLFLEIIGDDNE